MRGSTNASMSRASRVAPKADGENTRILRESSAAEIDGGTAAASAGSMPSTGRGLDWRRMCSLAWPERWLLLVATIGLVVSSSGNLIIIGVAGYGGLEKSTHTQTEKSTHKRKRVHSTRAHTHTHTPFVCVRTHTRTHTQTDKPNHIVNFKCNRVHMKPRTHAHTHHTSII